MRMILILGFVMGAGCGAGATAGAEHIEYRVRHESVSSMAADGACRLLGGAVSADASVVLDASGGRVMWLGHDPHNGLCSQIAPDGVVSEMSCYPQPDPTAYPGGYVCEVPHNGATSSTDRIAP